MNDNKTMIPKSRLEAFSDGVLAIIITIMVIELHAPAGTELASLKPLISELLSYLLSFLYIAIYWNNHHHLLHAAKHVNARVMWANLHLLFWLSLIPFATSWLDENHGKPWPTAFYGLILLMAGFAYHILQAFIVESQGKNSMLAKAIGRDWKGKVSLLSYAAAIGLAFVCDWASVLLYAGVALVWIIPDRRIENSV